jgi:hypothetical protein
MRKTHPKPLPEARLEKQIAALKAKSKAKAVKRVKKGVNHGL